MVKHIVCYTFKNAGDKQKAQDILLSMVGKVPQIIEISAKPDFLHSPRSYELALEVTVADKQQLDAYQQNEYHCNVVKAFMHSVVDKAVSVDYEF
ncbi:MAG: Dabb family protein [Clostridia bacterium]